MYGRHSIYVCDKRGRMDRGFALLHIWSGAWLESGGEVFWGTRIPIGGERALWLILELLFQKRSEKVWGL